MLLFLCLFHLAFVQQSPQTAGENPEVSWVAPDEYAIRRFAEIIENYQNDIPDRPTERLIRLRALLTLAEQKHRELNDPSPNRSSPESPLGLRRENLIKAISAKKEHYRKKISDLEKSIKRNR
jgi:hypothetical protein